jgi:(E)-4-hydroxy-3-methylbut-2-enyl-diphosphate synthase
VFIDGRKAVTLRGPTIAAEFQALVTDYIDKRYGATPRDAAE